jgi:hypothetical protein
MTQTADLLDLLRERGEQGVTPLDGLELIGTLRLAARISELRQDGYDIVTDIVPVGKSKHVARYRLIEELTLGFED